MIKSVSKFINYWYFRYSLVTELYMVEKWERAMIHMAFFIMLVVISLFNWTVVLGLTRMLYEPSSAGLIKSIVDFSIISTFLFMYLAITTNKK